MDATVRNKSILSLVRLFEVPKLERFATKAKFKKENTSPFGSNSYLAVGLPIKVHLWDTSGDFERGFLSGREGKIENRLEPMTLRVHDITAPAGQVYYSPFILTELWPNYLAKLAYVWHFLTLYAENKPHPLAIAKENIFFVEGRGRVKLVYRIGLKWVNNGDHEPFWGMRVWSIACLGNYDYSGTRVISF